MTKNVKQRPFPLPFSKQASSEPERGGHKSHSKGSSNAEEKYGAHLYGDAVRVRAYIGRVGWNEKCVVVFSVFQLSVPGTLRIGRRRQRRRFGIAQTSRLVRFRVPVVYFVAFFVDDCFPVVFFCVARDDEFCILVSNHPLLDWFLSLLCV